MTRTAVAAPYLPPKKLRVIALEETIHDLMGYVSLWNDVRPVVEAAGQLLRHQYSIAMGRTGGPPPDPADFRPYVNGDDLEALNAAYASYRALYPEHGA